MTPPSSSSDHVPSDSRRGFLKTSAAVSAAAVLAGVPVGPRSRGGSDALRVGLIGCGGRGTGAADNCVNSAEGVSIVALGDLFEDRLNRCKRNLEKKGIKIAGGEQQCFTGFDAYQKVLECDLDMVILATPPGFRPLHLEAAVAAGKHVFMEKPAAVDPAGVRRVMKAADEARAKGLCIVAGTQRRHQDSYLSTVGRIRDGGIGEVVGAQCYWNQGGLWVHKRREGETDVEWQIRNWLYFTWLSGDHIVEQHVHNLDVINWVIGTHPQKAMGMGGRQVRTGAEYGHIFDHFAIEYEYPGGVRVISMCRQIDGTATRVAERIVGTKGTADPGWWIKGAKSWRYKRRDAPSAYVQEHTDLIAAIRANEPLNEGRQVAESTLTAIMGRMSAYTGKEVTWDFALESKLDLVPSSTAFGDMETPAVAVPGKTPLV